LTGLVLTLDMFGDAHIRKVHEMLTHYLPRELQWDLGVITEPQAGVIEQLSEHALYTLTKHLRQKLDYTKIRAVGLSKSERNKRRDVVDIVAQALIKATLTPRPPGAEDFAMDATALWAHERSERSISQIAIKSASHPDQEEAELKILNEQVEAVTKDGQGIGKGEKGSSDASHGAKTNKDGTRSYFYGYDVHTVVRVPERTAGVRPEAPLAQAIIVVPASTDIVKPCLRMLDRILESGVRINHLLVDRHYSYKTYKRWLFELLARGIDQVSDLRNDDQGFIIWNGMKVAASWPHCVGTPNHLGVINSPGVAPTDGELETFFTKIEERQKYAVSFINRPNAEGKCKVSCPALNGSIGCSLREGTVATALQLGLPVVQNPPEPKVAPPICIQGSVTMRIQTEADERTMKNSQKEYWGSRKWKSLYGRRTFVEGFFGVLKGSSSTGLNRGSYRFVGLPMVTIMAASASA
jgi:hypothetical protein